LNLFERIDVVLEIRRVWRTVVG